MVVLEVLTNYITHFTYLAIVVMLLSGLIGVPIPQELILLLAGYFASIGVLNLFWVIVICVAESLLSDNVTFYIGKKKGVQLLRSRLAQQLFFTPKRMRKIENYFQIHGGKTILFARLLFGLRGLSFIFAGSSNMKWWTFQKYNFIGTIIWVPFVIIIGYLFSWTIVAFWKYSGYLKIIVFALLIILIGGYIFFKKFKKKEIEEQRIDDKQTDEILEEVDTVRKEDN